jgi:hypothetical protein
MQEGDKPDFFISYNHRDRQWAEWISWMLEEAHYNVIVQEWDFRPGNNFVIAMQDAAAKAKRTIAVFSPNYFGSEFVKPEWAAAFAGDPAGAKAQLVPIRVAQCDIPGMLGQITYIDLIGTGADEAKRRLLAGLQPGRAKPSSPPPFPGAAVSAGEPKFPVEPVKADLSWRVLSEAREAEWRESFEQHRYGAAYQTPTLELQLLAEPAQRIEVRRLDSLANELVGLGRQHGLFTASEQVEQKSTDQVAMAYTESTRDKDFTGVMATRTGQRGFWLPLPHDSLGSVFDRADVTTRMLALLDLLLTLPIALPESVAVAARVEPVSMLQLASLNVLDSRQSATFPFMSDTVDPVLPEDAVRLSELQANRAGFVDEVVARLESKLRRRR